MTDDQQLPRPSISSEYSSAPNRVIGEENNSGYLLSFSGSALPGQDAGDLSRAGAILAGYKPNFGLTDLLKRVLSIFACSLEIREDDDGILVADSYLVTTSANDTEYALFCRDDDGWRMFSGGSAEEVACDLAGEFAKALAARRL